MPGVKRMRPLFESVIGLWNERAPRSYDDLQRLARELAEHDADFHLNLIDIRPDDPLDFKVSLFKEAVGLRSPFGPVGGPPSRVGDHMERSFVARTVSPHYSRAKATGELHIGEIRGRHRDTMLAYDRLLLPLKTARGGAEHALSLLEFDYVLPAGGDEERRLTARERTILRLLVHGHERHDVMRRLGLSAEELERSQERIVEALGARNLVHAVALAAARGGEAGAEGASVGSVRSFTTLGQLLERRGEGIAVVGSRGRVLRLNQTAEEIMSDGGLHVARGLLRAERREESEMLARLIAECLDGPDASRRYAIASRRDRAPLSLLVRPLPLEMTAAEFHGPGVGVFISDPERLPLPTPEQLLQQFGLTSTEAAVALEVVNGDGVATVARRLGIAPGTAKIHLAQVFAKTGTNRQAQLVKLLLSLRHDIGMIRAPRP